MGKRGFLNGWIRSESAEEDKITVKRVFIDINDGNLIDGVMLSQIMYWHGHDKYGKRRMKIFREGELWLAKQYSAWWEECRVNESTARKSIDRMVKRGWLIKNVWHFDGIPTVHIRIDEEALERAIEKHDDDKDASMCPNRADENDLRGQMEMTLEDSSYNTETTTETTDNTPDAKAPEKTTATRDNDFQEKQPRKRTAAQKANDNLVQALGDSFGIEAQGRDYANYLRVAKEIVNAGIPQDEFARYISRLKKQAKSQGEWTVTINSLITNGRLSEYVTARDAYLAKQNKPHKPHTSEGYQQHDPALQPSGPDGLTDYERDNLKQLQRQEDERFTREKQESENQS